MRQIDLETLATLHVRGGLHAGPWLTISDDGQHLAAGGDNNLRILRTSDLESVFSSDDDAGWGVFTDSGYTFTCGTGGDDNGSVVICKYTDANWSRTTKAIDPNLSIAQVGMSPDGARWYLYSRQGPLYTWSFDVYDPMLDSLIFTDILVPGAGSLVPSPDGRYVFYNNPGTIMTGPSPPSTFSIYDVAQNTRIAEVDTRVLVDSTGQESYNPFSMVVTPDSRWLVMMDALPETCHRLVVYDIKRSRFHYYHDFGWFRFHSYLTMP